jgi:hypothetical protein
MELFLQYGIVSTVWNCSYRQCFPHVSKCQPLTYHGTKYDIIINIREHQRGNQKWTIQRNWQQSVHKTKRNKHQRNTIYATHRYAQTHTNNVNKTCAFLQTTGGKEEPNIVLCVNRNEHHNMELRLETLCIDVVYIANWSTKNIKKKYLWNISEWWLRFVELFIISCVAIGTY